MQELGQVPVRGFLETKLSSEAIGLLDPGPMDATREFIADPFGLD